MFGFIRRIPELLGLRLTPKPKPPAGAPGLKVVSGGKDGTPKAVVRGRGAGRGVTPPTPAKRSGARGPKTRKN